jgi:hypothetical protein
MIITCHECGNDLEIIEAELDGCNDLEISVELCRECCGPIEDESAGWEQRAMDAENEVEDLHDKLKAAHEYIEELDLAITETEMQMGER